MENPHSHLPAIARLLHKMAMGLYHKGLNAQMDGRAGLAHTAFMSGYRLELLSLKLISEDIQPLSATIEGSAAILAFHAGAKKDAMRLADSSLRCCIPDSLADVLREIVDERGVKSAAIPHRENKRVVQGGRCVIIGFGEDF